MTTGSPTSEVVDLFDDAHSAVAVGIAERYLAQPRDMTWEDRTDELATAAIGAMQIFIQQQREARAAVTLSNRDRT